MSRSELIRLTARVPRGQDGFWKVIRELDAKGPWAVIDVHDLCPAPQKRTVAGFVYQLVRGGFAQPSGERATKGNGTATKLYRLLKRPSDAPALRRDGTQLEVPAQQRLWTSIRAMKRFTLKELAFAAAGQHGPVPTETAKRYVFHLTRAGYLITDRGSFRLKPSMNTGPAAPKILRLHVVWDANRNQAVGGENAEAEAVQ